MKLADMRESITIEKAVVQTDLYGNRTNTYEVVCSRWAAANKSSGDETFEAGKTIEKEKLYFIVRYDSVTKLITPGEYRIIFRGKTYNITSVDNFKFRNESLTIDVEETDD